MRRTVWQTTLAFLAAAGVALVGTALGQELAATLRGRATGGGAMIVLFGWPVALGAALLHVPVYLLLAHFQRLTQAVAVGAGIVTGVVVGLLWSTEPLFLGWGPLVGGLAGHTWWRVWRSGRVPAGRDDAPVV